MTKQKSIFLWIFAIVFTLSAATYQRMTGPTHPERVETTINGEIYKFKLIRSHGGDEDAQIKVMLGEGMKGKVKYRRYKSEDSWSEVFFMATGEEKNDLKEFAAALPHQPPAGKLEYLVEIRNGRDDYFLNEVPIVIRFKGGVAAYILIPHIIFMFMAMLYSTRTGIEAIFKGEKTYKYALITIFSLLIGGLMLGPIVQLQAFGDLWTGWPFGGDWTDNKTIFAFAFWLIAVLVLRKNKQNRLWPIIAFLVLFTMYMIPHSMGGSELDHKTGKVETGLQK
ncbi:MAG: hypothetical protein B7C24_16230 [Bacteroidetes bacterium 4572_77]|nr:MAG: hypothetical protein B7C24_16230 [Bacteroidetes bacterium 4572_77]